MSEPADYEVVIQAEGLGKCYQVYGKPHHRLLQQFLPLGDGQRREFWALRELAFSVRRGETVGIIGRNGAGKSTLLQLLCGTQKATEGRVMVAGRVAALLELGAGFNPEFTGIENVYLSAAILGLNRQQTDARLEKILAFADIGDFVHQPVKHYSSGMFLRLAFAVVAHVDADILIVDEALAVGDALFTQKCMRFLREFQERGSILFVSHDLGAVTGLCQRVLWLDRGRLVMQGEAKAVTEAYLEHIYGMQQTLTSQPAEARQPATDTSAWREDARRDLLLHSNLRNDIQVFDFDPAKSGFGTGLVAVDKVAFKDQSGRDLAWLVGGEPIRLDVRFRAREAIEQVIVGFMVKDRLGQVLYGDNTYLTYLDAPFNLSAGQAGVASFRFRAPYLPTGEYAVTVAVASGTQAAHVQHCWIHEALLFRSDSAHFVSGLMGVPMEQIALEAASE